MHAVEGGIYVGWSPVGQTMQLPGNGGFQPVEPPPMIPGEDPGDQPPEGPSLPPDLGPQQLEPIPPPYEAPLKNAVEFAKKNPVLTIGAALLAARLLKII